jgi:hypothetical protein
MWQGRLLQLVFRRTKTQNLSHFKNGNTFDEARSFARQYITKTSGQSISSKVGWSLLNVIFGNVTANGRFDYQLLSCLSQSISIFIARKWVTFFYFELGVGKHLGSV